MRGGFASLSRCLLWSAVAFLALGACGKEQQGTPDWARVVVGDLNESERAQELRASEASAAIQYRMFGIIRMATAAGGAMPDLDCCADASAKALAEISGDKELAVGRTSYRLRNPKNAPPAWAKTLVDSGTDQDALFRHADGRIAALYPMRMQRSCLSCHGQSKDIPADVRSELAKLYPQDEAVNFTYPGIRGYVWVEVPAEN